MYRVGGRMSGFATGLRAVPVAMRLSSRERYALGTPSETGGQIIDPSGGALRERRESTILFNPTGRSDYPLGASGRQSLGSPELDT